MDKYVKEAINQGIEQLIHATVVMNLSANRQGFVRLMVGGLQRNQPASV